MVHGLSCNVWSVMLVLHSAALVAVSFKREFMQKLPTDSVLFQGKNRACSSKWLNSGGLVLNQCGNGGAVGAVA